MPVFETPAGELPGDLEAAVSRRDIQYLLEAMEAPVFETRVAAAYGLGELGDEKANLALLSIARDRWGQRPDVRAAALRSLGRIHDAGRYSDILSEFINGDNRKVMAAARKLLQSVDPGDYTRRLAESGAVDTGAIRAYGAGAEPHAVPVLMEFLAAREDARDAASSTYWGKVYAAVRALGNIGGGEAVEILEGFLSSLEDQEEGVSGTLARGRMDKMIAATRDSLQRLEKE
jgi:HEAT repeat protein